MIKFHCLHCGVRIKATPDRAGETAKCPQCAQTIQVPDIDIPPVVAAVDDIPPQAMPATTRLKAFIKRKVWDYSRAFLIGLPIALVLVVIAIQIGNMGNRTSSYSPSDHRTTRPHTGDTAILWVPSGKGVPFTFSQETYDRMKQLATARDTEGFTRLLLSGVAATTPTGTKCRIITDGFLNYEVRLLDGPHTGAAAFVSTDFVKRD